MDDQNTAVDDISSSDEKLCQAALTLVTFFRKRKKTYLHFNEHNQLRFLGSDALIKYYPASYHILAVRNACFCLCNPFHNHKHLRMFPSSVNKFALPYMRGHSDTSARHNWSSLLYISIFLLFPFYAYFLTSPITSAASILLSSFLPGGKYSSHFAATRAFQRITFNNESLPPREKLLTSWTHSWTDVRGPDADRMQQTSNYRK